MRIHPETLLVAFVVVINFGELNAMRPAPPILPPLTFEYADRWVRVLFDNHGVPSRIKFSKDNRHITPEEYSTHNVKRYLEFVNGIFFVVTTMEHEGIDRIVRADNAPGFNQQGFPTPGPPPAGTTHILGREISIYRDEHTQHITSMRFTDRNICPTEAQCDEFQITRKTYLFGSSGRHLRYYRLKNGYFMGVEII